MEVDSTGPLFWGKWLGNEKEPKAIGEETALRNFDRR